MNNSSIVIGILIKYILLGTSVAIAASLIPKTKIKKNEIITLGLTSAVIFLMLDIYAPSVGSGAKQGAGFGIGSQLVGGLTPAVEGMNGNNNNTMGGFSGRDQKLKKLHNETISREMNRLRYTGGSMHSDPQLNGDYHSYGMMGPEEEADFGLMNANKAAQQIFNAYDSKFGFSETSVEPFSEKYKQRKMKNLNNLGKSGIRDLSE